MDLSISRSARRWRSAAWVGALLLCAARSAGAAPLQLNLSPGEQSAGDPALDFDLLGSRSLPKAPPVEDGRLRWRRGLLTGHQAGGFGLLALDLATTVVGQLNYNDRYASGDATSRFKLTHAILAWGTLGTFVATGTLAFLAPAPPERRAEGFDRVSLHKLCMFTAAAGMAAQGVLGIATRERTGRLDQGTWAAVHLAIGYVTFAAVATGFGALVF